MFLLDHPEIDEQVAAMSLEPGEERLLITVEAKLDSGVEVLDIKAAMDERGDTYIRAYPHA